MINKLKETATNIVASFGGIFIGILLTLTTNCCNRIQNQAHIIIETLSEMTNIIGEAETVTISLLISFVICVIYEELFDLIVYAIKEGYKRLSNKIEK